MEKTNNKLIQAWQFGASLVILSTNEQKPTEQVQELAKTQINMLNETRPNKEKTLKEQLNNEQLELLNYLEKVVETGEF